jgi:hypothetical protein
VTLPGPVLNERDLVTSRTPSTETGVLYVAAPAAKGPVGSAQLVTSPTAFRNKYGADVTYSVLCAYVDTAFANGLSKVYVSRVVGPGAAPASVTLKDAGNVDCMVVAAADPGPHANGWTVDVAAGGGAGTFFLTVKDASGVVLTESGDLADGAAAMVWAALTGYVTVDPLTANDPKPVVAAALVGGDDDRSHITDSDRVGALAAFDPDLGPGQVAIPGASTPTAHLGLLTHGRDNRRRALLDLPDTDDVATLTAAALAIRSNGDGSLSKYGAMFASWAIVSGDVQNRYVPWSAVVAGHLARNDAAFGHANVPAAGKNGIANVLGVTQAFGKADRETLNDAGINAVRLVGGQPRTYGFRTVANPAAFKLHWQFANVRLDMQIAAEAEVVQEEEEFEVIDGEGIEVSHYGGRLTALLDKFYALKAIYGKTADEARSVDVGPAVNDDGTAAEGRIRAVLAYRRSPMAERVELDLVHVAVTDAV